MALQKKEKLRRYLTRNHHQRLDDLVRNRLRVQDIGRYFDVSKQTVYEVLDTLDYSDIQERRSKYMAQQCGIIHQLTQEGIPLDNLWEHGELDCFKIYVKKSTTMAYLRQHVIRRLKQYGLINDGQIDMYKHVMVASKLQSYVETLQIAYLIQQDQMQVTYIADFFRTSNTRAINIKDDLYRYGNPLPRLPRSLSRVICRNIRMCLDKAIRCMDVESIAKQYRLDTTIVERIIESTMPYVRTEKRFEDMNIDAFD